MLIGMVVLLGTVVGCSVFGGRNENARWNDYAKYYVGTRGIEAKFVDMPTRLYYYGPQDNQGNAFSFGVDVHNYGASFSRGGVYVSGFDPDLLYFQEIPIQRGSPACGISIGSIGFGELGGIFRCDGVEVSGGNGMTNLRIDSMGKIVNALAGQAKWDVTKFDTSIDLTHNPTGTQFMVNFNRDPTVAQLDFYQHGRLFIYFLAGIDFVKNGGREFLLAGNTYELPGGEGQQLWYNGKVVGWPAGLDQTTQNFLLTTCYQYTTYADPIVCIDPYPESDNRKVCYPRAITWNGGNGGPVAVTSVEQENTPRKIIFHINVKNVGTGTVYDPGQLEKCSPYSPQRSTPADFNVVYLGDVRVGNSGLRTSSGGVITCYPSPIRLDPATRSGSTTCTYPLDDKVLTKSAYQTPLVVELWYGYSQTQQRSITIKRVI
jgi:hypothetical protein